MIRITGGKFKKKKLISINNFVRPTSSLKREAFFSIIESYAIKNSINLYKNKIFLDLFAGIGTMGLESISRGMNEVIFFENNSEQGCMFKRLILGTTVRVIICMQRERFIMGKMARLVVTIGKWVFYRGSTVETAKTIIENSPSCTTLQVLHGSNTARTSQRSTVPSPPCAL